MSGLIDSVRQMNIKVHSPVKWVISFTGSGPSLFKKIRDDYNDRVGFSQVNIKDCNDPQIKKSLEILGFKVI